MLQIPHQNEKLEYKYIYSEIIFRASNTHINFQI